jgi:hypothetical protein
MEAVTAGEQAWSDPVPLRVAFDRLHAQLHTPPPRATTPPPTVQEVEQALDALILRTGELAAAIPPVRVVLDVVLGVAADPVAPAAMAGGELPNVNHYDNTNQLHGIDTLFSNIESPLLQHPASCRTHCDNPTLDNSVSPKSLHLVIKR